jgi:hypothetical protein
MRLRLVIFASPQEKLRGNYSGLSLYQPIFGPLSRPDAPPLIDRFKAAMAELRAGIRATFTRFLAAQVSSGRTGTCIC